MLSLLGTLIGRTALFLIFSFLFAAFSNADAVSFTPLENLPSSTSSEANGISPDGSNIVGSSGGQAAVWTDIGAFGLGYLPGYESSQALDIPFFSWSSNIDPIVGTAYSSTGMEQAFRWSKDTGMVGLGFLTGDDRSRAYGISGDRIVIVGTSFNSTDSYKAFRWVRGDGEMVNIGTGIAIGASFHGEVIVGRSNGEAFRWTQSTGIVGLGDLPGGDFYSSATAVSSDGSVVVGFGETSEGRRAFRWTESEGMVDIGNLPGYSEAHAVSSDGSVIVGMVNARQYPFEFEAFIWDEVNGMRYLRDVLTGVYGLDLTGWHLGDARGISYNGNIIVGIGQNPDGFNQAWIADISEGIRVYGEFSGYIDDNDGPEAFLNEIGLGTRFKGTFSYNTDMPIVWYSGGPTYSDDSFSMECTFFGKTQEHHLTGSYADIQVKNGTTDSFNFHGWGLKGLIAGYQVHEGALYLRDSTGTAFDDDSIPTSLELDDFDINSYWHLLTGNTPDQSDFIELYGTLDSLTAHPDYCPNDPNKIDPGVCGCGVPDTDSDGDGTFDCVDDCPNDPGKTDPGTCGCGVADVDTDTDGTFDCNDNCPNDPNKTEPGVCGCGIPDTDSDGDGILDCNDDCDNSIDTDGDGVSDCDDLCPNDSNKTQPGTCGCGVADTDTDLDGTLDCNDDCPNDSNKTQPGTCGCGIADTDTDLDGTPDCTDGCPNDINKSQPGICGCGIPDTDSDGDGIPDCNDDCDNSIDSDGDGLNDCDDLCPNDSNKTAPGTCGCGIADSDSDGDGTLDCMDVNDDGDGLPDGEEQGPDRNNPGYDGNGDGIADYLQGNVASFHTYNDQNYITIASPSGTTIRNCKAVNKPSSPNSPQNVDFPHGFFGFDIDDLAPGDAATATMYFPAGESFNTYYRYGPTPDNPINHWYEFLHDGQTGANLNGNVITLHFVDGLKGDDDLTTNGSISDIGAPGLIIDSGDGGGNVSPVVSGSGGGGGGCFISLTANKIF